jgi:hypothetical protein
MGGQIQNGECAGGRESGNESVHRMYPTLGAPVSLDAPVLGDGPPLIERVSEGLWLA